MNYFSSEKRTTPRLSLSNRPVQLTVGNTGKVITCTMKDVSAAGLGITCHESLFPDNYLILQIDNIKVYLSVMWCTATDRISGGYSYGLKALDNKINLATLLIETGYAELSILVVDDERYLSELYSDFLVAQGFDVEIAGSGNEAIAKMTEKRFHVIISDLIMPNGNGLKVLSEARFQNIPAALISCNAQPYRELIPAGIKVYDKLNLCSEKMTAMIAEVFFSGEIR